MKSKMSHEYFILNSNNPMPCFSENNTEIKIIAGFVFVTFFLDYIIQAVYEYLQI